ncbi:glutathione S-transferase family protein [Sphingomonas mollis]|uniref:Glutathione S-transferase family protein n=1 Tax=Sphingomonas mollis TaxID=2795726 RepID=A0ABS0XQ87_9SPHN|nr:glutathione S-transferase family protein [Sphingomonas sp. BT553]MBJ6122197.1 glutathione S-transferase family protein [Sphingomonas sp. BT553]
MALTFYTNPQSRGRIARWMLEEVGVPYETVVLDYQGSMKGDDYRAINPMMKVPAIVHDGQVVTEGAAICAYLADAFPDAGLAPTPAERADYYRWLFFAAGPLEAAVTDRSMKVEPTAEQQRMAGYGNFDLTASVLEQAVGRHPYIAGDRFTAADVYVGSGVSWYTQFGLIPKTPVMAAYLERILSRPAYKRAGELDDAAAAGVGQSG